MTVAEVLAAYPYVPGSTPLDFRRGTLEMLGCVSDEGYRAALASLFLACEPRWVERETKERARELRRTYQPQSREHLDPHWSER